MSEVQGRSIDIFVVCIVIAPMKESATKIYYSISEVAHMLQVKVSLLRFWEKEFSELSPRKTRKGKRQFNAQDIELLQIIHQLVKKQGYTLEGAKQVLNKNKKVLKEQQKHLQALKDLRCFLTQLRDTLKK